MNTDISTDRYDELLILARDTRLRRRWTQRITTGLIVGAMGLNFAYVYALSQAMQDEMKDAADQRALVAQLERERDRFMVQAMMYERQGDALVAIAPTLELGSSLNELGDRLIAALAADPVSPPGEEESGSLMYEMIWLVDGTRRVPMTINDILWIPQTRSRVKLTEADGSKLTFEIRTEDPPVSGSQPIVTTEEVELDMYADEENTSRIVTTDDDGNTECVTLAPLGPSTRVPMAGFIDLDVRFEGCD